MRLADINDFTKGTRQLLNAYGTNGLPESPDNQAVRERVEGYIEVLQMKFLLEAVGCPMAERIDAYLSSLKGTEEDERDADLDTITGYLKEPFADYVMYYLLRDAGQLPTINGIVRLDTSNTYVDVSTRQVSVWNDMVERMRLFVSKGIEGTDTDCNLLTTINTFNL